MKIWILPPHSCAQAFLISFYPTNLLVCKVVSGAVVFFPQVSYSEIDFVLKELLYLFENMALVVSSAQYIAC